MGNSFREHYALSPAPTVRGEGQSLHLRDIRLEFSSDGNCLMCMMEFSGERPKIHSWATSSWESLSTSQELSSESFRSTLEKPRARIIELESRDFDVEIEGAPAAKSPQRFGPFERPFPISFSEDGKQIAVHDCIVELNTGAIRQLPAVVQAFLPGEDRLLCSQLDEPFGQRSFWRGGGNVSLPLVRHYWHEGIRHRLLVVDSRSALVLRKSQLMRGYLNEVLVSENGNVAVARHDGILTFCEIPD